MFALDDEPRVWLNFIVNPSQKVLTYPMVEWGICKDDIGLFEQFSGHLENIEQMTVACGLSWKRSRFFEVVWQSLCLSLQKCILMRLAITLLNQVHRFLRNNLSQWRQVRLA